MALTKNKNVLAWVDEMVALTKPDKVVWIDGSKEQLDALTDEVTSLPEGNRDKMYRLNEEKLPGCLYHRTLPNDVARVEDRTFICTKKKEDAGPTNNILPDGFFKCRKPRPRVVEPRNCLMECLCRIIRQKPLEAAECDRALIKLLRRFHLIKAARPGDKPVRPPVVPVCVTVVRFVVHGRDDI